MHVRDLILALESIAQPSLAEPWDNTGLILGDPARTFHGPVLLAIDLNPAVLLEAREMNAGAIVCYHPPIFAPIKHLTASSPRAAALLAAAECGIAIYSPHTALDAAPGGLADWLLDGAMTDAAITGAGADRRALTPHESPHRGATHKLVTFIPTDPPDLLPRVREALARTGAGTIGDYDTCSFSTPGTGSFRAGERANPTIGARGSLESVGEIRLEMVCPARALPEIIAALCAAHPYEEPAFDLYPLAPAPDPFIGPGRAASLDAPTEPDALAQRIKSFLRVPFVKVASPDPARPVTRLGVCPGAGGSLIDAACARGCDAFLTGEMRHHEVLDAVDRGLTILLAGHTNTERGYLPILASKLREANSAIEAHVSTRDRWPFVIV